ncbi:MAG: serine acetyltransferase [Rhodobacterales bacterium]
MTDAHIPPAAVVSSNDPDWSREHPLRLWDPSRRLLKAVRNYQALDGSTGFWSGFLRRLCVIRHRFWSVVAGAEIDLTTKIGGGLLLPHPNGIVIHPLAEIGPNCLIFQQVTLGTTARGGYPRIGGHVDIGAGARVLGEVVIGDHAVIGANAVVLADVPPYGRAVGDPAVITLRAQQAPDAPV